MEMLARPGAGRSHSFCGHWLHIDEVSKRVEKQPDQPKLWFISGNTGIRHATTELNNTRSSYRVAAEFLLKGV